MGGSHKTNADNQANTVLTNGRLDMGTLMGAEAANYLALTLQGEAALTCVDLSNRGVDVRSIRLVTEALETVANSWRGVWKRPGDNISEIDLSGNKLGFEGACLAADAVRACKNLQSLKLRNVGFSDEACEPLAKVLTKHGALRELDLTGNTIFKWCSWYFHKEGLF